MNKLIIFTLALFACAFASFPLRHHKLNLNSREDVLAFTKGFLTALGEDPVFENIKSCLSESSTFYKDLSTGIADIQTKNPEKVKEGIKLIGQAVQIIPQAAKDCQAAEADIQKLIKLATAFTNPRSFIYTVAKSLLINRVEVFNEVSQAVAAFQHHDFTQLGYWVGKAMDTIFLGLHQKLRQGNVDFINQGNFGWKAELPKKFEGMTLDEIKNQYLGAELPDYTKADEITVFDYEGLETNDIPSYFNSSETWPGCVHPIRDQGHCGSCWAFAASEVLSDRFCIASKNSINVVLSPQYSVSCDSTSFGCSGGFPYPSWVFIQNTGLPTEGCFPYKSYNGSAYNCKSFTACEDGSPLKFYHAKKGSLVQLGNPTSIQQNILQYGPLEAAFSVYEDFISYKSGVYKHTSGSLLGGHAVKIIGWGNENGTDYWIVANSWNTTWGENGFFRIAFNQCGIDRAVVGGQADVDSARQSQWFN